MKLFDLLTREHERLERDLTGTIAGWETSRPERQEYGALQRANAWLMAQERALWFSMVAVCFESTDDIALAHHRIRARVAEWG